MNTLNDGEVIAQSKANPARFGLIFDRHHAAVHAYLQRRVGPHEADDLAAETFVTAFRARARYDVEREHARTWLFGIATNLLRHHWRRERRQLRAYARTGIDPVTAGIEEAENRVDAIREGPRLGARSGLPAPHGTGGAAAARVGGSLERGDRGGSGDSPRHGSLASLAGASAHDGTNLPERESRC